MTAKSDDWYRQAISLAWQMAESEARRMLALKTQRVLANARMPPPSDREMEAMLDRYLPAGIEAARAHPPKPPYRPETLPTIEAPSIAPKP
jgi:hypothetical protein